MMCDVSPAERDFAQRTSHIAHRTSDITHVSLLY